MRTMKKYFSGIAAVFSIFYITLLADELIANRIQTYFANLFHTDKLFGIHYPTILMVLCAVCMTVFSIFGYRTDIIKKKYGTVLLIAVGIFLSLLAIFSDITSFA